MKKTLSYIMATAMIIGSISLCSVSSADEVDIIVENGLIYYDVGDSILILKGAEDKEISSVTIPASVNGKNVIAETGVFSDCPNLVSINVDIENVDLKSIDGVLFDASQKRLVSYPRGLKGDYSIPDGTVSIAENAFENAAFLTKLNIPKTLASIGSYAFKNCIALTNFSSPLPKMQSGDSLYGCTALKSVELASVSQPTTIANLKFENCPDLEKVVIPHNYILSGAFKLSRCPKLKEVVLPEYATELLLTISECEQLSSFVMPECTNVDMTSYSNVAINNCPKITELELSNAKRITVENMSSLEVLKLTAVPYADKNDIYNKIDYSTCPKLKDIYLYNADIHPTPQETELMAKNDITIHCRNVAGWSSYLDDYNVNYVFIDNEMVYGDVNIDGTINMSDAVTIMQSLANPDKYTLSDSQKKRADITGDNDGVTNADALTIQKYLLKLTDSLLIK